MAASPQIGRRAWDGGLMSGRKRVRPVDRQSADEYGAQRQGDGPVSAQCAADGARTTARGYDAPDPCGHAECESCRIAPANMDKYEQAGRALARPLPAARAGYCRDLRGGGG